MNFDRIRAPVDIEKTPSLLATVVGGAYGLAADLVRCGLGAVTLVDFDFADGVNVARQDVMAEDAARRIHKTKACAQQLRSINPEVSVETLERDFCSLTDEEVEAHFAHTNLFVFATDSFPAQARGHIIAPRLGVPAIWIGLYAQGRAGEIIHYVPGVTKACYHCVCPSRYSAYRSPQRPATTSEGGTILDLRVVDGIAGQIALGILTRGADNRFGRLIQQMGNRNLTQVKLDPGYTLNGKDIFAQHLGSGPANFCFTAICLPMEPEPGCPDCGGRASKE